MGLSNLQSYQTRRQGRSISKGVHFDSSASACASSLCYWCEKCIYDIGFVTKIILCCNKVGVRVLVSKYYRARVNRTNREMKHLKNNSLSAVLTFTLGNVSFEAVICVDYVSYVW